jgi:hypothetical protein
VCFVVPVVRGFNRNQEVSLVGLVDHLNGAVENCVWASSGVDGGKAAAEMLRKS